MILFTQTIHKKQRQKIKKTFFNLIVQYLDKYSSTTQQQAYRGLSHVNEQQELWLEEGEEVDDGGAEGSSAPGGRGSGQKHEHS